MPELAIHPQTRRQLDSFQAAPSHAVMLVGATGSGKRSLAISAVEAALGVDNFADYPYGRIIASQEGKAIGIEAVRELEHFLQLKVPGTAAYSRAVIIEDAQLLGVEAQNALLKTLEEPPKGTLLVLTVNNPQSVLPTIRSRAQSITVTPPDKQTLQATFEGFDAKAVEQAYVMSGGLPGLMQALLTDSEHPLAEATQRARSLLGQTTYERLLMVDELSKQRQLAQDVAFILQQMAHVSLQKANDQAAQKWQLILTAAYEAAEALQANAQSKLVLTKLMLSL